MSKNYAFTPEQLMRRKEIRKKMLYASFIIFTIFLSAAVTILANNTL